ncbi:MAG TPA: transcriptional regulator, partial [Catenuloplanes sp.]
MPSLPQSTSTDLLVLHAVRCIGFAGLARVSEATGLPDADVESELIDLAVAGLVTHAPGDFGGWGLTDA